MVKSALILLTDWGTRLDWKSISTNGLGLILPFRRPGGHWAAFPSSRDGLWFLLLVAEMLRANGIARYVRLVLRTGSLLERSPDIGFISPRFGRAIEPRQKFTGLHFTGDFFSESFDLDETVFLLRKRFFGQLLKTRMRVIPRGSDMP